MEKDIIFCKTAVEEHKNIKKHAQDMNFYAKVVWKVAGLKLLQKKHGDESKKWEELEKQGVEYHYVEPELKQSGLIKLCEHKHAKM
jgi:intracellular sulfur oxidation DsrE/DsrF family protein